MDKKITAVFVRDRDNNIVKYSGDYFISTMPIKNLIESFDKKSEQVLEVARGLIYRDFMIAGILVKNLEISNNSKFASYKNRIPDEWIYIQDREVRAGRMEIFNNWSPYIIKDYENTMWLGVEYFCNKGDELWSMKDEDFLDFAVKELEKINILKSENVLDKCLIKVEKAYPAYFGTYDKFETVKNFTDKFENLFLVGRNGMHKYNNMDHSMLSAMTAVDNIINGVKTKDNIWAVNAEQDYHEQKSE